MFRSATFRLTLWYLAIVMAISLIFSAVLYNVATGELSRGLHHETQRIYTQYPVFQDDPVFRPGSDLANGSRRILLKLIGLNAAVLVGAGFASYFLARRTLEPIEAAHEQQKRFTADVSHELRTPLTAIRMESEVALMDPKAPTGELRETLTSNLEEVTKLEALINNLLRLTRLEADELQQQFSPVSTAAITETAVQQVQKLAEERAISIVSHVKDSIIVGDHDSLVQLLVILLDNALKYSPPQSRISITSVSNHNHAILEIKDQGSGIDKQALDHVFDRFYRAENSRNKVHTEGFGLGLSIAKMIGDLHHADITLRSKIGQGTTAVLTIPRYNGKMSQHDMVPANTSNTGTSSNN